MNNEEIQIQFPRPGQWGEFALTAIYRDAEGYAHTDQGGRRIFTTINYPAFVLTDPAAVAFFKYFTKQNHE